MTLSLREAFHNGAKGLFPPADGGFTLVPPPKPGFRAVVAFTAHALIAADVSRGALEALGCDGYGGALHPRVLMFLGETGEIDANDCTLVAHGRGGVGGLVERHDLEHHPRVRLARTFREGVRVLGDERGFVTLGHGIGDRLELGIETWAERHGTGAGRALIADSLSHVAAGEPVFAAVSPGNARSLRAFLSVGFTPIASEVIIRL